VNHEDSGVAKRELPGGRSLFGITLVDAITEFSAWIAILVVAFDKGGAGAAGLAVVVQLVPAALFAPIVTAAGDRFARHLVLMSSFAIQALTAGGIAGALIADLPLVVVYLLAAAFTVASSATPAAVVSLFVHYARTPAELMQWNITRSFVRSAGILIGPLVTAIVLAVWSPSVVFLMIGIGCATTSVLIGLRLPRDDRLRSTVTASLILHDSLQGVRYVITHRHPRRVVAYIGAVEMLMGTFDVIFVAVAFEQLGRGGSASALITAAFAVGALLAATIASRRLAWQLSSLATIGALLLTVPLLALGKPTLLVAVMILVALLGAGNGFIEIGTQTLLQRSCSETMTSRAFGALDSAALVAAAVGAAATGAVIDESDLTSGLLVIGVVGVVVLVIGSIALRGSERAAAPKDEKLVQQLRSVSFLQSLPQPTLERLARSLEQRVDEPGTEFVRQGEAGEEFFVVLSGAVDIEIDGSVIDHLVAPSSFGEVALLHDDVRAATVTATETTRVAIIQQTDFLDAISRTATSHRDALHVADQYRRQPDE